jgi:CRP-like cAMP-binding protein
MLDKDDRAKFQKVFPQYVSRLSPAGLERLLSSCTVVNFHPGYNVFRDRMPTDSLHFVLEGQADIFLEQGETPVPLGKVNAGQLLGEISVLSRTLVASSTVQAASRLTTLRLQHQPLESLLWDEDVGPTLLELLSDTLASRLQPLPA